MANNVQKIAAQFIGAARKNPKRAPEILRHAASTFANLATDPANARAARKLTAIGLDFAGAAAEAAQQATTSDFKKLLQDTAQAWDELGPEAAMSSGAAMDATAFQRQNVAEQAQTVDNAVSIQPKTFLNKDVTLGRVATVTFNPDAEQIKQGILQNQTVAFWQGAKRESQAMTIDIGTVLAPVQAATSPRFAVYISARPYAILQYGADGNTQNSIPIDVGLGRRVTVVGNYISVVVGMDPPPVGKTGHVVVSGAVLTMGASIGTFAAPSQAPVTRSLYFDVLAPNVFSGPIPIPLRAAYVLPPMAPTGADVVTIEFLSFNQNGLGIFSYTINTAGPFMTPFPVPSGAYFVIVKSLNGVASGSTGALILPFELSL